MPKKAGHFNSSFRVGLITAPWTTIPILMLRHRRGHFCHFQPVFLTFFILIVNFSFDTMNKPTFLQQRRF
ncbi:hypothetical protein FUA19_15590 [Bacillus subtilis]|nr:hypothetical protein CDO84_18790 [Bacillus sp. MD-5]AUS11962.1 hypothetical protein C0W65_07895 [Bacillus subtilis]AUZ41006.1 hypothetical protein C1T29_23320 [Bacillus sp. MBGLi79]PAO70656.1 hypothetical protein CIK44_01450 [Bacillus sp. X2(2017)]POO82265.1 hypothetical protein C1T30_11430 [Bacillus sp. MBGLi97]